MNLKKVFEKVKKLVTSDVQLIKIYVLIALTSTCEIILIKTKWNVRFLSFYLSSLQESL